MHDGLPATLIVDSAAAALMAQGRVDAVVVGADRIAANGDTANKIGTYSLAVNAAQHGWGHSLFCRPLASVRISHLVTHELLLRWRLESCNQCVPQDTPL